MQNTVLIGAIAILALGGIWFISSSGTSYTDAEPASTNEEAMDNEQNAMDTEFQTDTTTSNETEPTPAPISAVEIAMATPNLTTLVTAVTEAELATTLNGEGPFTIFAPTNAAFEALPAGTLDTLLSPAGQSDLQSILTYHVVPGEIMTSVISDGMTVETVNGETLTFAVSDAGVTVNGVAVSTADIEASNGVVHIIDGVLLPQ